VDYLQTDNISTIQIEFYTGIGTTQKTPVITQSLPVSIRNEKVLVFDDIVDRGETMKLATQYLQYHGAAEIKTAALINKPWSTFKVDYAARQSEAWVIFPNEIRETIETLIELWQENGDSNSQILEQLAQIGFSEAEVALFAKLK
jgi:hypoxanthine phosphoribosyltransferase